MGRGYLSQVFAQLLDGIQLLDVLVVLRHLRCQPAKQWKLVIAQCYDHHSVVLSEGYHNLRNQHFGNPLLVLILVLIKTIQYKGVFVMSTLLGVQSLANTAAALQARRYVP